MMVIYTKVERLEVVQVNLFGRRIGAPQQVEKLR
jgi:hypothetical protein